jgi:hypothetical protein
LRFDRSKNDVLLAWTLRKSRPPSSLTGVSSHEPGRRFRHFYRSAQVVCVVRTLDVLSALVRTAFGVVLLVRRHATTTVLSVVFVTVDRTVLFLILLSYFGDCFIVFIVCYALTMTKRRVPEIKAIYAHVSLIIANGSLFVSAAFLRSRGDVSHYSPIELMYYIACYSHMQFVHGHSRPFLKNGPRALLGSCALAAYMVQCDSLETMHMCRTSEYTVELCLRRETYALQMPGTFNTSSCALTTYYMTNAT